MKVLRAGDTNRAERWVLDYAWDCGQCGAILQFEPKDFESTSEEIPEANASQTRKPLVQLHDSQMDGQYFTTTCAYCGKDMSGSKGRGLPLADIQTGTYDVRETRIENPILLGCERHPRGWGKGINQR